MRTTEIDMYDYDSLRRCPFCGSGENLTSSPSNPQTGLELARCAHFVAAFEHGAWGDNICSPVTCDGFLFDEKKLLALVTDDESVVSVEKEGTARHPAISLYFTEDPNFASELRRICKLPVIWGPICGECGNDYAVLEGRTRMLCSLCGALSSFDYSESNATTAASFVN